jgi:hypothetical protein
MKDRDGNYLYSDQFVTTQEGTLCKVTDTTHNSIILGVVRIEMQEEGYTEPVLGGQIMLPQRDAGSLQVLPRSSFCWSPVATEV